MPGQMPVIDVESTPPEDPIPAAETLEVMLENFSVSSGTHNDEELDPESELTALAMIIDDAEILDDLARLQAIIDRAEGM